VKLVKKSQDEDLTIVSDNKKHSRTTEYNADDPNTHRQCNTYDPNTHHPWTNNRGDRRNILNDSLATPISPTDLRAKLPRLSAKRPSSAECSTSAPKLQDDRRNSSEFASACICITFCNHTTTALLPAALNTATAHY